MTVKELKSLIDDFPDDLPVYCSVLNERTESFAYEILKAEGGGIPGLMNDNLMLFVGDGFDL